MPITTQQARERLSRMVAAETEPKLSVKDLNLLLEMTSLTDANGIAPTAVGWEPTYNLIKAAVEGWRWKAGMTSDLSTTRTGDLTFEDAAIHQHCLNMVKQYQRMLFTSVTMGTALTEGDTAITEDEEV